MKLGTFTKQPGERESYTITYEDDLTDGDNVQTATASVSPIGGLAVEQVFVIDPRVRFFVEGGVSGESYKVTVVVNTADGRRLEDEVIIKIKEI